MADENTTDPSTGDDPNLPPESIEAPPSATTEAPIATKDAEGGSTPDLPSEPVEATASATANDEGSSTPELPQATEKATPSTRIDTEKHKECRIEPRIHVRWHADALINGQDVYHGFIKDISLKGTDIFLDRSLQKVKFVKLRIHVPPLGVTSETRVIEVSGKIVYTAYDSNEILFHTGVSFTQFNLESDLAYLRSRIANY